VCYIAKNQGKGVVLSQSISKSYDIPLEYLLKILQQLVRANVLRSKRGPRGGFCLARPTGKISLLEIIEAVDGPMSGDLNLQEQAKGEKFSKKADDVYEKAVNSSKAVFAKTKLSSLISEGKK
jgi:Rrf2 family protein